MQVLLSQGCILLSQTTWQTYHGTCRMVQQYAITLSYLVLMGFKTNNSFFVPAF